MIHRRKLIALLSMGLFFLLCVGVALNLSLSEQMKAIISRGFNQEQLTLAQNTGMVIERELNGIRREALFLAGRFSDMPFDLTQFAPASRNSLYRTIEKGVHRIEVIDLPNDSAWEFTTYNQYFVACDLQEDFKELITKAEISPQQVYTSPIIKKQSALEMYMIVPLDGRPGKYINYVLNVAWFLKPFMIHVRSGASGYGWIIDQNGMFLFHQETSFIGYSCFQARKEKNPSLSYREIDHIQQKKMIKGLKGTDYYYSGWHRGITGRIRKMVAYSPIQVSEYPPRLWSIAVAAPVYEIQDDIQKIHNWQYVWQVFFVAILLSCAALVIWMEVRWSTAMERRVEERTKELARSEEKYRLLLESAEDFIFSVDKDLNLDSINSYTAKFLGGRADDFVGRSFASLFSHEEAERQLVLINRVFGRGKSVRDELVWLIDNEEIWLDISFMPLKNGQGEVTRVLGIARDITENKKLERSLINAEKLASIGTLAAGVAHEINNPLGIILGFVDLMQRRFKDGDQAFEDLQIIERQGLQCKQVVENLLSFARKDENQYDWSDLNFCLKDILQVVRHSLEMKKIELIEHYDPAELIVRGDERKLQQVFLNLINNASAAMPGGGILRIQTKLERQSRSAVVAIADNGHGIEAEHLKHIFEPFFTTKPPGEGTGLGLFVSYGIINQYGGTIECVSHRGGQPGKNSGTRFTVKLRLRTEGD